MPQSVVIGIHGLQRQLSIFYFGNGLKTLLTLRGNKSANGAFRWASTSYFGLSQAMSVSLGETIFRVGFIVKISAKLVRSRRHADQ